MSDYEINNKVIDVNVEDGDGFLRVGIIHSNTSVTLAAPSYELNTIIERPAVIPVETPLV